MELAAKRFADTVALFPTGRIDHASADAFKAALAPYLAGVASGRDRAVLDLSGLEYISSAGLRVLMLASKQAKAQGGALVVAAPRSRWCARSSRSAASTWSSRCFPRCARRSPRLSPAALAAFEAGLRLARARPLLGHARLDPGRADLRRRPAQARRRAGAGGGPRARHRRSKARAFVEHELDFSVSHTFGGNSSCVRARDRRRRLRALRPGQRRARLRQPRARHPRALRAPLPRLHVPRALGPHHGLPVLHARLPPGQPRPHLRLPRRRSRRPSAARTRRPASRWTSRGWAPRIEFVRLEPEPRLRDRRASGSGPSCSATAATPTATASSSDGKAVVYSTDSEHKQDDPAEAAASWSSSATPTS